MALESLRITQVGARAEVCLLGPGPGNALGPALFRELPVVFAQLDADPAVRAILLHASGEHFCFGLDLVEMAGELTAVAGPAGGRADVRAELLERIQRMQAAVGAVETCRKPVVAVVQGWCIGGGVDLIAACDIRLASADARFSVREVKVGIVADLGSLQRLPRLIGESAARELALTGRDIAAERAAAIGLVSEVYSDATAAIAAGRDLVDEISANPPLAVQGTKQVLNASRDLSVPDGLRHVAIWNSAFLASQEITDALAAFAEKRGGHGDKRRPALTESTSDY